MAKWSGGYIEFGDDVCFREYSEILTDVVVSKDKIAMDWSSDGIVFGVTLLPVQEDGQTLWKGSVRTRMTNCGEIKAIRYDLKDGGVLLITQWHQNGFEGSGMYELYLDK